MNLESLVKGIVKKIVRGYAGFTLDTGDLVGEGYLIAVEQMGNYSTKAGAALSTYMYNQVNRRLRNYVARQMMKASYGTEDMQRVSMELVDSEITADNKETQMMLDDFGLSLETVEEQKIFRLLRDGYTYREIRDNLGISLGKISSTVDNWRAK